jgi:hypothetical protein
MENILKNKYISTSLLVTLLVCSNYYIPHPLLPLNFIVFIQQNKIICFLLTLLLSYIISKDIYIALVSTCVIFTLNLICKYINKEPFDDITTLINKYNYELDKNYKNILFPTYGYSTPDRTPNLPNENPKLILNNNHTVSEPIEHEKLKNVSKHIKDDFEFSPDNLKYIQ